MYAAKIAAAVSSQAQAGMPGGASGSGVQNLGDVSSEPSTPGAVGASQGRMTSAGLVMTAQSAQLPPPYGYASYGSAGGASGGYYAPHDSQSHMRP